MKSNVSKLPQPKIETEKTAEQLQAEGATIGILKGFEEGKPIVASYASEVVVTQPATSLPEAKSIELNSVMIELPLLPIEGYVRKRVDVTFTSSEAHALKSVKNALEAKSAQLSNGKHVTSVSDAVRWIVQQIMV